MKRRTMLALLAVTALAGAGLYRLLNPAPPDLTGGGFTAVTVEFREWDESNPALTVSSSDPAVIAALARVLRAGRNDVNCRCAYLAKATLSRPGRRPYTLLITPAHGADDCQVTADDKRFRVNRQDFLTAVAPLGVPAARWIGR